MKTTSKTKILSWSIATTLGLAAITGVMIHQNNKGTPGSNSIDKELQISQGGINKDWGIMTLDGAAEVGDITYSKRLGRENGLMKVEAVEEGKILVDGSNANVASLVEGDVMIIQKN